MPIETEDLHPLARDGGFSTTRKELLSGRLGVWASLLASLGVGPAVNVSIFLESQTEDVLEIEELQTRWFRITGPYIKKVLESEAVVEHPPPPGATSDPALSHLHNCETGNPRTHITRY